MGERRIALRAEVPPSAGPGRRVSVVPATPSGGVAASAPGLRRRCRRSAAPRRHPNGSAAGDGLHDGQAGGASTADSAPFPAAGRGSGRGTLLGSIDDDPQVERSSRGRTKPRRDRRSGSGGCPGSRLARTPPTRQAACGESALQARASGEATMRFAVPLVRSPKDSRHRLQGPVGSARSWVACDRGDDGADAPLRSLLRSRDPTNRAGSRGRLHRRRRCR